MQACILEFSLYSGLHLNSNKSHYYLANVPDAKKVTILDCVGYPLGVIPAKFLGVPLISSRLSFRDCISLLNRIISRVTSWTNYTLSYFGRLQLIKVVLFSIQSYWVAHFIILKGVLSALQQILCRFL